MNFRVIRKQVASLSIAGMVRRSRYFGFGTAICALLGTAVIAQTANDFIDPLSEERVRVEQIENASDSSPATRENPARSNNAGTRQEGNDLLSRARDGATSGATAAQERATGFWGKMRGAVSDIAASLGLPTAGLLGILGLMLAGLAALVGWTLFRGRDAGRRTHRRDVGVYARSKKSTERRQPGDAIPFATTASAQDEPEFEETMPEDFEKIFEEERASDPVPPKTADAKSWRKPNLDRLRDSIKADWKAEKDDKAQSATRSETHAPITASELNARPEPANTNLDDISDGWEEWDDQVKPEDDPWGETLTTGNDTTAKQDEAAIQRIRALRESLRAS